MDYKIFASRWIGPLEELISELEKSGKTDNENRDKLEEAKKLLRFYKEICKK